ncbi:MAG: GFA family protein [Sandaracinaceae bacterium]
MTDEAAHVFEGGCHCGAVRLRVVARALEALDCNCSICFKKGFLHLIVPREDFTLLTDEAALAEYRFGTRTARHLFCRRCGVHPFYIPRSHPDRVDVNVRCLEPPALDRFTVVPFDGLRWEESVDTIR